MLFYKKTYNQTGIHIWKKLKHLDQFKQTVVPHTFSIILPFLSKMSLTIPKTDQNGTEFKFFLHCGPVGQGHRGLWTTLPMNLTKSDRTMLNRLVRELEYQKLLVLPQTLSKLKKTEVLALVQPLVKYE